MNLGRLLSRHWTKAGLRVLCGILMSAIPSFEYSLICGERVARSVANNTREDGREFLAEVSSVPVETNVEKFSLEQANDTLIALKYDAILGTAVIVMQDER